MLSYGLCKLVAGEIALYECRHLQTSPLFKIHIFEDIQHLHTVWVADAASFQSR